MNNSNQDSSKIAPLKKFAYLHDFQNKLKYLADHLAEPENWYYDVDDYTETHKEYGVLYQYLMHTFNKAEEEEKIESDDKHAIMNTGLLTQRGEEIFMLFVKNKFPDRQEWFFQTFLKESDYQIPDKFRSKLPSHVDYMAKNPELSYFDPKLKIISNLDHILHDNYDRLPKLLKDLPKENLNSVFDGLLKVLEKKLLRNNRLAVPQYYKKQIMYLVPIIFGEEILVLAIQRDSDTYRVNTILTKGMAYCNARLVMKPESNWLNNNK